MYVNLAQKNYYDSDFGGMLVDTEKEESRTKIEVTDSTVLERGAIVGVKVMIWRSRKNTNTRCFKEYIDRIIEEIPSVYLLKYFCYFEGNHNFHVVTEFCGDKNLYVTLTEMKKLKSWLSEDDQKKLIGQLTTALFILNRGKNKKPHGALTTQNILVLDDLQIKIDLGSSAVVENMAVQLSTPREETQINLDELEPQETPPIHPSSEEAEVFVAPELKEKSCAYTEKSDVYSMGMIFKHIACVNGAYDKSSDLGKVIEAMLCTAVENRLGVQGEPNSVDLITMPYIRSAVLSLRWNTLPAAICEAYGVKADEDPKKNN